MGIHKAECKTYRHLFIFHGWGEFRQAYLAFEYARYCPALEFLSETDAYILLEYCDHVADFHLVVHMSLSAPKSGLGSNPF